MDSIFYLKDKTHYSMNLYYHAHGPFAGMSRVVKVTEMKYARHFHTQAAAEAFAAALPDWLQDRFAVEEASGWTQFVNGCGGKKHLTYSMEGAPLGLMLSC